MPTRSLRARRQPRQARSRETVEALLEAAAQVFERHGYAAGTTNRIAARAGVSIGSLYQYYPSKDAILLALVERHVAEGEAALAPLAGWLAGDSSPGLRDGLQALVAAMVALHADRPALHRVLFEEAPRPPALRRRLDGLATQAADAIAAWLRACPEVRVADPELAARLVVQTVESITHTLVIHPAADRPPAAWTAATVAMLAAYLAAVPVDDRHPAPR
ncbi:TetR/AcrR family transcriptional regulator [Conexibacter stalactiti]|uniref:TetR/AcrR family transcriptional regulator n=1 Tax=Conexibacter stalactiti TaxID=1940611 RepID=A0ABU4HS36_9ACTN|nr:TetR/AcrR family transcriptional regulator [Conexibacter stalactiti]MDW5596142.1 TetR/AcrR family transcriptional regulator [Conexibacter stalactiti]MEC5036784.1 TetR/AcrR family transcriptional regulator [Conexibacter stalactiti]